MSSKPPPSARSVPSRGCAAVSKAVAGGASVLAVAPAAGAMSSACRRWRARSARRARSSCSRAAWRAAPRRRRRRSSPRSRRRLPTPSTRAAPSTTTRRCCSACCASRSTRLDGYYLTQPKDAAPPGADADAAKKGFSSASLASTTEAYAALPATSGCAARRPRLRRRCRARPRARGRAVHLAARRPQPPRRRRRRRRGRGARALRGRVARRRRGGGGAGNTTWRRARRRGGRRGARARDERRGRAREERRPGAYAHAPRAPRRPPSARACCSPSRRPTSTGCARWPSASSATPRRQARRARVETYATVAAAVAPAAAGERRIIGQFRGGEKARCHLHSSFAVGLYAVVAD